MSDKPISVGDLVVMIRVGHPCAEELFGVPFTVTRIFNPIHGRCNLCGEFVSKETAASGDAHWGGIPLSWLKRLDPSNLSEDVPEAEKVGA